MPAPLSPVMKKMRPSSLLPCFLAAIAAPTTIGLAGRFDRRHVLWFLLGLLVISNVLVATATGFTALLAGRVLLGIGVGGFWTIGGSLGLPVEDKPRPRCPIMLALNERARAGVNSKSRDPSVCRSRTNSGRTGRPA